MSATSFIVIFFLSHLVLLYSAREEEVHQQRCQSFPCGDWGNISFPFFDTTARECGGLCEVDCRAKTIKLGNESRLYGVLGKFQPADSIEIRDYVLDQNLWSQNCDAFQNLSLPNSPSISFSIKGRNTTFFKCNSSFGHTYNEHFREYCSYARCAGDSLFYRCANESVFKTNPLPQGCSVVQLPEKPLHLPDFGGDNPFKLVDSTFQLSWHVSVDCFNCHSKGGKCDTNELNKFYCAYPKQGGSKSTVILASVIPGGFIIVICILIFIIWRRNKWNYIPYFLSRNKSSDLYSSASELEGGTVYFGVPIFSYSILEEATNNFDPSKKLGHGGFGTVYHGILRDGREVAVKRLYENNCKRVEQFKNEIEILTRLRHCNLVLLYGCTSRRSTELVLVYEYIPNGTVADHLHGDRAETGSLTWPIRMNITIETASALSYLHKSDIIHRDVKTNNILLDNNFRVKVADFGLSRLFPIGATHVSTAPQGTPGYVDPEYHQCYQLTDRSDVYSFGVVLIELISSMPAVDINRHRQEINLANLAINRIQRCAFNELIDPCLRYESDAAVERMTTLVAELAFRCLQLDKEMRPTMDEVLETLKDIRDYDFKVEKNAGPPPSPESEGAVLLTIAKFQSSPGIVGDKWVTSRSTPPNASG